MKKIFFLLLAAAGATIMGCREKYVPNINEPSTGYLVVDGYINSGTGPTTITLTRTTKLSTAAVSRESKAVVRVESKSGGPGTVLTEIGTTGVYSGTPTINPTDQYRLYIKTTAGKEYLSDYSAVRRTPAIDSVTWRQESDGVHIYGNTHNTAEPVGFYQWKFDETWEIHSVYTTSLKVYFTPAGVPDRFDWRDASMGPDLSMFFCWKNDTLKSIKVNSTEKLTQNTVSMFPLQFIENNSWKLDVRYSINTKVYSISRENMKFLEQLKKNTELLGSIFDAQPSDNVGNIHCTGNPSEIVIGFVEVSEEKLKRIFIDRSQLNGWRFILGDCTLESIANKPPAPVLGPYSGRIPTQPSFMTLFGHIDSAFVADPVCVDCRLRGSNVKPSFW